MTRYAYIYIILFEEKKVKKNVFFSLPVVSDLVVVGGLSYQQETILFYQLFQQWESVRYCNYSFFEGAWDTYSVLHFIFR